MEQHLIVIRGNSATGKTTLAREVQLAMGRGTANIGQDHFRRVVLREHDAPGALNIGFIEASVRHCLGIGYHVIVEGILVAEHYGEMLRRLLADHDGSRHVFHLELSLEETLARHAGRPLAAEVTADQVRQWYVPDNRLGVPGEVVLDARRPLDELVAEVLSHVGPVTPRPDASGARFL